MSSDPRVEDLTMQTTMIGWYSKKAAVLLGHPNVEYIFTAGPDGRMRPIPYTPSPRGGSVYATPDGREVTVTEVRRDSSRPMWDDAVCVGEVTRWLRDAPPRPLTPQSSVTVGVPDGE